MTHALFVNAQDIFYTLGCEGSAIVLLTQKELNRYFKRRRYGGRSTLARALDYTALRLILFIAAFLFFRLRVDTVRAVILAAIALTISALLLHVVRDVTMERFIKKELRNIRRVLMREKLAYLDEEAFLSLCKRAGSCDDPIPLQRAEPVGADTLLPLLRHNTARTVVVCSSAGFTPAAETFVSRSSAMRPQQRARLLGPDALIAAAGPNDALWPDDEAVDAYISSELRLGAKMRARLKEFFGSGAWGGASAKKYAITALILLAASFLTRYTLYYRVLAGLCLTIAATAVFFRRVPHPNARS